jgi:hypothetical protein
MKRGYLLYLKYSLKGGKISSLKPTFIPFGTKGMCIFLSVRIAADSAEI